MIPSTIKIVSDDKYPNLPFFNPYLGIKKVIISGKIKHINNMMFYGWENLTEVIIENGVESIGDFAFAYCINLKKVFIPDSVHFISDTAFYGNIKLEKVTLEKNNNTVINKFYLNYLKLRMRLLGLTSKRYNDSFNGNFICGSENIPKIENIDNSNIITDKKLDDEFIPWTKMDENIYNSFGCSFNYRLTDQNQEKLLEIVKQNAEFEIDNQGNIFYCGDLMTPLQIETLLKNMEVSNIFKKSK